MLTADRFLRSGKVRDLYDIGFDRLLLVASDRISAFDVVLPTPVPDKGRVLTGLSRFWFEATRELVPNHLLGWDPALLGDAPPAPVAELRGRMMVCARLRIHPVEWVVRGYLAGSGWKDYVRDGRVSGVRLPAGLREGDRLPEPILTPSTKAELGRHDQPIDFDAAATLVGGDVAEAVRASSLAIYRFAAAAVEKVGLLLADTKLEFGDSGHEGEPPYLADEVLTPDSSRFWEAEAYAPGGPQASFDKQFVRDWLERQPWAKTAPGPALPDDVVAGTRARYVEAFERITGGSFDRYLAEDVIGPARNVDEEAG
jgi:phosphoribosylaminoimidazole-succinocarboxamide synthase